jgi:predicted CoA-binding protein
MSIKTLVIGASENPERYAYKAAVSLIEHGNEVVLFGIRPGEVKGIKFLTEFPSKIDNLDTVTLYINPTIQKDYYAKILALSPIRVIFNPGTENPDFEKKATEKGIECLEACTLVMLSTDQY